MCLLQCDKLLFDRRDFTLEALEVPLHVFLFSLSHHDPILECALFPLQLRYPQLVSRHGRFDLRFERGVLLLEVVNDLPEIDVLLHLIVLG